MSIRRDARARRHPAIWLFSLLAAAACAAACGATGTGPSADSNLQTGATGTAGPGPSAATSSATSASSAAASGAASSSATAVASSSGAPASGPVPDPSCASCLDGAVEWEYEGGLRFASNTTRVDPCRTYRRTRTYHRDLNHEPMSCSAPLPCDESATGVGKLKKLLKDPEVQKALSPTMKVFGCDSRPVDGAIFVITVEGKGSIGVGSDCSHPCPAPQSGGCIDPPAGVKALREHMNSLDDQMTAEPACKALATK